MVEASVMARWSIFLRRTWTVDFGVVVYLLGNIVV